jgi:predicted ferric reductase
VVALALVLAHVGALYLLSPEDTRFALSPDGPTRARMAVLGTVALVVVVGLGLARERLPMARATWRVLHAFFATLVLALGLGHAVLTDGALDGAGTVVLLVLGGVAAAGVAATQLRRGRRPPLTR